MRSGKSGPTRSGELGNYSENESECNSDDESSYNSSKINSRSSISKFRNKRLKKGQNKMSNSSSKIEGLRRSERIRDMPRISYNENSIAENYMLSAQSFLFEVPQSFEEIKYRDDKLLWEHAIKEELNSLLVNDTWKLVPRPKNKNIVDCKWIFTIKQDELGNPTKYKARLVARGFSQEYLKDYNETFAPVARISSFRIILAIANQFDLLVHHMDVKTAFLNGDLKEEIFMRVPEGVESKQDEVCLLNKALYGLKQAARCWFMKFETVLLSLGFKNSPVDRCMYILFKGNFHENIYVILYVDDVVIVTGNVEIMNKFKIYLMNKFSMKDLKEIKMFLGIKVERVENKITLDQSVYIKSILSKYNMIDCNSVDTPLPSKVNFEILNSDEFYDAPCRNLIGSLMYVMICTRPDLSAVVNILSRYSNKNNRELWCYLKRVLRYLKGSINNKLTYRKTNFQNMLLGYVDSDWGGNDDNNRRSTTGYLFKLFESCTVCWNTKRQTSVAASSTEAEYMALYEAVKEALWLKSLLESIRFEILQPIIIYEDNNGCICIANNPSSHKRSKHISIKYHFSREQIEKNVIKLIYIPTGKQIADILTKSLPAIKFKELKIGIGLE